MSTPRRLRSLAREVRLAMPARWAGPTHDPQLPWRAVGVCHGPGGPGTAVWGVGIRVQRER